MSAENCDKLQEILSLLLAAGYFRARIQTLSDFDKIVGGMTWCMEMCDFDVDVDLFFQENSSIGQKIALTERIVTVLQQMKCPYRIEPHQIQGCDIEHIFPVLQWLVKTGIEFQSEQGEKIRSYSLYQFHHMFSNNLAFHNNFNLDKCKDIFPKRVFRPKEFTRKGTQKERVTSTLFEFGEGNGSDSCEAMVQEDVSDEEVFKTHTSLMSKKVDPRIINTIIGSQVAEIREVASKYSSLKGLSDEYIAANIEKQLDKSKSQTYKLETAIAEAKENYKSLVNDHEMLSAQKEGLQMKVKQCQEKLSSIKKSDLKSFQSYILLLNTFKKDESEYRRHCYSELERWKDLINKAQDSMSEDVDIIDYDDQLAKRQNVLALKRLDLAKRSREVFQLSQRIDQVPSRAELSQYQHRFLELYDMISSKHRETKQFYLSYNVLCETQGYLSKELSLLDSILENYQKTSTGEFSREDFLTKFSEINQLLKRNLTKVEDKLKQQSHMKKILSDKYLKLLEVQRSYARAVKQFTEEYKKNELLMRKLSTKP